MRRKLILCICTAAAIIAVAVIVVCTRFYPRLVLENANTGERYATFRLPKNATFSVEFIHSVNKTPVRDFYEVRGNGDIYVVETHYYSFGAGVQTELNPGETLEYGDDGSMQIKNINALIPILIYAIGENDDHLLIINETTVKLHDICGYNSIIRLKTAGF